jgi:hypothetical protein
MQKADNNDYFSWLAGIFSKTIIVLLLMEAEIHSEKFEDEKAI